MSIVQFSSLGNNGRFGNQLFQYAFARAYAEKYNASLEIPSDWFGYEVFKDIKGRPISKNIKSSKMDTTPPLQEGACINLFGYYQSAEALEYLSVKKIREWFQFKDSIFEKFKDTKHDIVIHKRRGDYVKHRKRFCIVSEKSYYDLCEKEGLDASKALWVSDENDGKNATEDEKKNSLLNDFFELMNAETMIRSNSTFSYWAGILGNNKKIYSPIVRGVGEQNVEFKDDNWEAIVEPQYHKKLSHVTIGSLKIKK